MANEALVAETHNIEKYYFFSYQEDGKVCNAITVSHPIQVQLNETRRGFAKFMVIGWNELSKEEYELFKDQL